MADEVVELVGKRVRVTGMVEMGDVKIQALPMKVLGMT